MPLLKMEAWTVLQDLTTRVSVKVQVGAGLLATLRLHGRGQLVFLQLSVEGAVGPVGEGGASGLQAAAGAPGVCSPPPVLWGPH